MSFIGHAVHAVAHAIGDVAGDVGDVVKKFGPAALTVAGVVTAQPELVAAGMAAMHLDPDSNKYADLAAGLVSGGAGIAAGISSAEAGGSFLSSVGAGFKAAAGISTSASGVVGPNAANELWSKAMAGENGGSSVFGDIGQGIDSLFGGASSSFGSFIDSIGKGFSDIFNDGFSGFLKDVGDFSNSAIGIVDKIANTVNSFLSPITKVVTDIDNVAQTIEDKLVLPITSVITQTEDSAKSLIDGIHNDLSKGLAGIVNIPSTVASALTSEGATLQRANQELASSNAGTVANILVPGLKGAIGNPLAQIAAQLLPTFKASQQQLGNSPRVELGENSIEDTIQGLYDKLNKIYSDIPWPFNQIVSLPVGLFETAWSFFGILEAWKRAGELAGKAADPPEPLPLEVITRAVRRGIMDPKQAPGEAAMNGIDAGRYEILQEMQNQLLDVPMLREALWRNLISLDQYTALLALLGYDTNQAGLIKDVSAFLYPAADAVRLFARGSISKQDMQQVLNANRMNQADQEALPQLLRELPQPVSAIDAHRRELGASIGVLHDIFSIPMPDEISLIYGERMIDPRQAAYDWINHWELLSTRDWFIAYKRGLVSKGDFYQAMTSKAIPDLLQPVVEGVERTLIPFWYIKEILATGKVDKATGMSWLTGQGFSSEDAELVFEASAPAALNSNPAIAQDLAKLTATSGKDLYEAGSITKELYTELLMNLGYSTESAALTVELADLAINKDARTALVDTLKAQAVAGQVTAQQASAEMYAQGFTTTEVNQAVAEIEDDIAKKIKLPSESELGSMLKKGVIDANTYLTTMTQLGYSQQWAERIMAIE